MKRAYDPAPRGQSLDFVKEKVAGCFARQLMESGQQFFHILGAKIAEAIIFEIDEEDILPTRLSGAQEFGDHLIEEICFASAPGPDDRKDRPREAEVRQGPFARGQGREFRAPNPLGDNP
jgi:hypothetical protein